MSGMRGAPPKASLGADYMGPPPRPQSAMSILRGDVEAGSMKRRPSTADNSRPIPERLKNRVEVHAFDKQMTRERWASRPMR